MTQPIKILIAGNGFGGVYTLKRLHKFFHKNPQVELSLVGEKNYFLFTPLLHEVATGSISPENIIEPIRKVLKCCLKQFYSGKIEIVNTNTKTVKVGNIFIPYDYLILAPGAETNFYNVPGAEKYSFTLKSIDDAIKIKNNCIAVMDRASHIEDKVLREQMLKFVVVGGGPTGVELAAELQELVKESFKRYYPKEIIKDTSVVLIQKGPELLSQFGEKVRIKSLEVLRKKGVKVLLKTRVKEVTESYVELEDNTKIMTNTTIWVGGVKPIDLNFDLPVVKSSDGRLVVNKYLEIKNYKNIFAIGDVAAFEEKGSFLPMLAQVAEKEARALAKNIKLLIGGKKPKPFSYHNTGNLVSLGQWMAIGEISNFVFWGHITWWIWRTVYLSKLLSWEKKMEVVFDWTINLFSARDISQL